MQGFFYEGGSVDFGVCLRGVAACVSMDDLKKVSEACKGGGTRTPTPCSARMLWGEFRQVVHRAIDYYPEIIGNIMLRDLLDGNNSRHVGEG